MESVYKKADWQKRSKEEVFVVTETVVDRVFVVSPEGLTLASCDQLWYRS